MSSFCEAKVGVRSNNICGAPPVGRCLSCGLTICKTHSHLLDFKVFCEDCVQIRSGGAALNLQDVSPDSESSYEGDFETDQVILFKGEDF
jgi:hypothetical protein